MYACSAAPDGVELPRPFPAEHSLSRLVTKPPRPRIVTLIVNNILVRILEVHIIFDEFVGATGRPNAAWNGILDRARRLTLGLPNDSHCFCAIDRQLDNNVRVFQPDRNGQHAITHLKQNRDDGRAHDLPQFLIDGDGLARVFLVISTQTFVFFGRWAMFVVACGMDAVLARTKAAFVTVKPTAFGIDDDVTPDEL
jgi:hypothetical protein